MLTGEPTVAQLQDVLADIYLYIDWRYVTKQMTTENKNLFADAVEAGSLEDMEVDRWWEG